MMLTECRHAMETIHLVQLPDANSAKLKFQSLGHVPGDNTGPIQVESTRSYHIISYHIQCWIVPRSFVYGAEIMGELPQVLSLKMVGWAAAFHAQRTFLIHRQHIFPNSLCKQIRPGAWQPCRGGLSYSLPWLSG